MKKMMIYDPAMCCSTGVCGPSVDKNLLRVATTINKLEKKGVKIERYNLSDNPQAFIDNRDVNKLLNEKGVNVLPITIVDNEVVNTEVYPSDEEIVKLLGLSDDYLSEKSAVSEFKLDTVKNEYSGCCGSTGCC